jgi:hypothetical protein
MSGPFVFLSPVADETIEVGSIVKISWSGGPPLPQHVVLSLVNINKWTVVGTGIPPYVNNSSIGLFEYTVPTNFFQLSAAGSPTDSFQFYIQDVAQTTWAYGPHISITATNDFVLKLFQVPVSFGTNEARNLQSALDEISPNADQILATAQQASDPGHAEIGTAAGQLAKALGTAQSPQGLVSVGANLVDKVVQRANSLGTSASQIITKAQVVLPAIRLMADSWTRVHDGPSLNKALDDTTDAVNLIAGLFAALGVAMTLLGIPLGAVLTATSLSVIKIATATDAVATEAVGLIDPATGAG